MLPQPEPLGAIRTVYQTLGPVSEGRKGGSEMNNLRRSWAPETVKLARHGRVVRPGFNTGGAMRGRRYGTHGRGWRLTAGAATMAKTGGLHHKMVGLVVAALACAGLTVPGLPARAADGLAPI